ncbi:hypothetical protein [Pseudoalteromonas umbrosa]|uniref:hypothetical protein n=1 Tax=Pseudoalteromonas umbrosa TaxID=3048489 RepID=UPI0024C323A3|nr:hypothetical protein [Pseudoalteromonas sp. B95]MDK1290197.1 hypothetical protein [Pseudoalteromonas sp. B95]
MRPKRTTECTAELNLHQQDISPTYSRAECILQRFHTPEHHVDEAEVLAQFGFGKEAGVLYEMGKGKIQAAKKSVAKETKPALSHVLKVLIYQDPLNLPKHLNDIGKWLENAARVSNTKGWTEDFWYEALLIWPLGAERQSYDSDISLSDVDKFVRKEHGSSYKNLPRRLDKGDLIPLLTSIYEKLAFDIANGNFNRRAISQYFDLSKAERTVIKHSAKTI